MAKYIQFSGLDKVGKTTTIRTLTKQLRAAGFSVAIYTELPTETVDPVHNFSEYLRNTINGDSSFTGHPLEDKKYFGMMFMVNRIMYQSSLNELLLNNDFVLQDRGIADTLSYCAYPEIPLILEMADNGLIKQPNLIVHVYEPTELIASRIKADLNEDDIFESTDFDSIDDRKQRFGESLDLIDERWEIPVFDFVPTERQEIGHTTLFDTLVSSIN